MNKTASILILALVLAFASFAHAEEAPASRGVVNINTANATQLALLPGIGAKAAERIVAYRTKHGSFAKTSQLMDVKGIGEKSFERLAPYIALSGETTLMSKVRMPRAKKP